MSREDIWKKITDMLGNLASDYSMSLAADLTRDYLKGQPSNKAQALLAVDEAAREGKFEEAYSALRAIWKNLGERDEEILLQDTMTVHAQRAKFKVKEQAVFTWMRFLARLPEEAQNRFRHAHMTELDDNARLYKLARLIKLANNAVREAALKQAGIMNKSKVTKFLEALKEWDARFEKANRRLDRNYRRIRRDITDAAEQRRTRGFGRTLWDMVRPQPII